MKIGYDAKRLFNNFTGLGNYSRTLVKNYLKYTSENELKLFSPSYSKNSINSYFVDNKIFTKITSSSTLDKNYWRIFGILKDIEKEDIDIFHGLSNELPLNISKSNAKSIVTIHDLIFKVYPKTYKFFDREIYDFKFRKACENSDKIIAISESTKADIINYYNIAEEKIDVLYQACSPVFYENEEDKTTDLEGIPDEFLLYVGSIIERKNLKTIIKAYSQLKADFQIPLLVVGNGKSYKNEVLELISRLGLKDKIIFYGNLKDDKALKSLYQKAKILIYPSVYEGFGLPVAEASLCKTPVITSNVSSLPEAGGEDVFHINPLNADEMTFAIEKVLSDKSLSEYMSEKSYQYAMEKFNPHILSQKLDEIYKSLI